MSTKDTDQFDEFLNLLQPWEEEAAAIHYSIRRFKSSGGRPVLNLTQLAEMEPSREESKFVRTSYNRFAFKMRSKRAPEFPS